MTADLFRVVLPALDLERADAFWAHMLGVPIDRGVPMRHYIRTGGAILVLVDPREHGGTHRPNPECLYFRVPDLDATWATARELGCPAPAASEGSGIQKRAWGDLSFYTRDPDGNPICFIDDVRSDVPPQWAEYTGKPTPNLSAVVLPTTDLGRSDAFYEALLELEAHTAVPKRHSFATRSCRLTLVEPVGPATELPEFRPNPEVVYFAVPDLDAAWARAQQLGLDSLGDDHVGIGILQRVWGERSFYGRDPSGNPICLVDDQTLYTGSS